MSEWKDVIWWDDYAVSDEGEIVRKKDGVVMKQYVQKNGYAAVYLKKNGWTSAVMVHRIVAKAFLPIIQGKEYVDHINTIRHDNRVCNLRWVDPKGNANNETTKKNRKRKTMKKFNELSLNITEDEYRNNGRFHYSDIAGYMRKGFSYLITPEKEESESLTFGSLVDCLVTQGMEEFEKRYCVSKEFNLSDNQKSAIKDLVEYGFENLSDNDPEVIYAVLEQYYKNPKSQVTKLFEEGSEYYKFLYDTKGKIAVDYQMYQDAIDVANRVLTSYSTSEYFTGTTQDVDKFFQLKFNGTIEGIPVTCMVDGLYVDHYKKTIWPIDLKTTCASYEWEFPKAFIKWRYDVQAKLYSTILRQVMDADDEYKDYKLEGFVFVYVSRQNKTPLIWTFENNLDDSDIVIEKQNGDKILLEDFRKPLKEMNRIKEEELKLPADISLIYGNDVLKHLNKMKL